MATKTVSETISQFQAGFVDERGAIAIPARFDMVSTFAGGWAPVCVGGKWGCIDATGAYGFEPRFDLLKELENGRFVFRDGGQWGVVDPQGTVVFDVQPKPVLAAAEGVVLLRGEQGLELVDYAGQTVLARLDDIFPFRCGRATVVVGGRSGVIDARGGWIVQPNYDAIYAYSEDMAAFERNGLIGWLDAAGQEVIAPTFQAAFGFVQGLARVRNDRQFGFVDTKGSLVIPYAFDEVTNFNEGLATAFKDGKSIAIDRAGATVFTSALRWVRPGFGNKETMQGFASELAIVVSDSGIGHQLYGYVNSAGQTVIEPRFFSATNFSGGAACVGVERSIFALIDRKGGVLRGGLDRKTVFSEGLASVRLVNPKWEEMQESVELGAKFEAKITKFMTKLEAALEKSKPALEKFAKAVLDADVPNGEKLEMIIYDMNDFGIVVSTLEGMDTIEIAGKPPLHAVAKLFEDGIMEEPKTRKGIQRAAEAYNTATQRWLTWFVETFRSVGEPRVPTFVHGEISDAWIDLRTGATTDESNARAG